MIGVPVVTFRRGQGYASLVFPFPAFAGLAEVGVRLDRKGFFRGKYFKEKGKAAETGVYCFAQKAGGFSAYQGIQGNGPAAAFRQGGAVRVYPHPEFSPGFSGLIGGVQKPGYPLGRTPGVVFNRVFQFEETLLFGGFVFNQNFVYPGDKVQGKPLRLVLIRGISPEYPVLLRFLHIIAEEKTGNHRQFKRVFQAGFFTGIFNLDAVLI